MPGPPPAVAATRRAVRDALAPLGPGHLVLVGCSGGADSLALAAAVSFEASRRGILAGAVVVDHGLQDASADVAVEAARQCRDLGLDPVVVERVEVRGGRDGPEASARTARYAALDRAADAHRASVVLLGHTLDDQAELVLLGLLRGSGARSLAGMPRARDRFHRPFLGITREQTRAACLAAGLTPWDDPHNTDPAYARVRARQWLSALETDLGTGVRAALARTADQLRVDSDHLDALADAEVADLGTGPYAVSRLAGIPTAVRGRVWRRLLLATGAPGGQVSARHTDACDALLTDWRGQGPVHVPGPLLVSRDGGRVSIEGHTPVQWT